MRTCPNCGHQFDDREEMPNKCPSCDREFTVSDVSAATIDFSAGMPDDSAQKNALTVVEPPTAGAATINLPPPSSKTTPDGLGQTLQSGRWSPPADELADAGSAAEIMRTLDSSFLGSAESVSAIQRTLDSSFIGPGGGSSIPSPPRAHDATAMWDSSHVLSDSQMADLGGKKPGSSLGSLGSSMAGRASMANRSVAQQSIMSSDSLEHSLVIQPRVLRPEDTGPERAHERIDYNLLKKLGEGGMGIVYAARQQSIRRVVALKMLKKTGQGESFQREKFLAEAVITGDLEHPNIVPIYDLGRDEAGAIFYAMKHVKGTPWDNSVKKNTVHENLEILMKVADAVAFAHSKDVIHRDLKPENVMLGDFGEVLVMDWGLALMIGSPPANVAMGGTPGYMAPEMAMGPIDTIGFHSDIYLLGAILYEIVTGVRAHTGKTVTRCLMAAAKNEIVPTEKTGELVEIALKAMATKPEDRYQSVRDFQNAVKQYQAHIESIALGSRAQDDLEEARRSDQYDTYARSLFAFQEAYSLWNGNTKAKAGTIEAALAYAESAERKGDFDLGLSLVNKKEPAHAAVIEKLEKSRAERESRQRRLRTARRVGLALVATIFVIITGAFFWIRSEAARALAAEKVAVKAEKVAVEQKGVAEEQRTEAVRQKGVAEEQRTQAVAARQEEEKQRQAAELAKEEADRQREFADTARKQEEYEAYIARIGLAAAKIEENAFDHALELISQCPQPLRNWEWGRLRYLCSRDLKSFDCGQPLEAVAVSADGKQMATGGWGGEVRVQTIENGEQVASFPSGGTYVFSLAFSPDGKELAVGTNAKPEFISLFDPATGKRLRSLHGHSDAVLSLAFSQDGSKLLSGSYDGAARLWNLADGTSREFRGHDWWVWSVAFSPDEKRFVTASQDGSAIVWNIATGQASPPFLAHTGPVYSAAFSPDGEHVATGSYDKSILIWRPQDLKTQDLDKLLNQLVSDTITPQQTPFVGLEGHTAGVRTVRFSSDGKLLVSGGNDNNVCVWDVATHQMVKKLRGHASRVSAALFMPGNDRVLSAAYDHYAKLWNISKYEEVRVLGGRVLKGHHDSVLGATFSPDGKTVVTASRDRSAVAWDVATGKQLRSYTEGHAYLASAALFFPDGKRVLTAAVDNTARIWDMATGTQLVTLEGTGTAAAVALSHDGQWIVTGSDDKLLRVWNSEGQALREIRGFTSDVTSLAVSLDDRFIITGDSIGRCRLLKADTGEMVWETRKHSATITAAAFLPSGKRVLTSSLDNSVAQWDVEKGTEDLRLILKHPEPVTAMAVSTDGTRVLTASVDNVVRYWDTDKAEVLKTIPYAAAPTTEVAFSPDGRRGMTTTSDHRLHLWDLASGNEIHAPGEKQGAFLDLSATTLVLWSGSFSADGTRLLTVGGAEAHLWEAADAKQLMTFSPQSAVSSVQFAKGGEQIVTGSWDNSARIWNAATGATLVKLGGVHTRFVNASVFSPDGTRVLTASDDKTVRMWDATNGKLVASFVGHEGRVTDVAFSSDGKWIVTASDDKTARIWDVSTGEVLHVLKGHTQAVLCARFSNDGKRVVTGSDDTTAKLWDATTGEPLGITLAGHTASVTSVAFTPDSLRVLTGSKDITAKLWDPQSGKEILTLTGHTEEITTVSASPDGSSLLTGSRDGTAIVWLTMPWTDAAPVAMSLPQYRPE
jgi:hypothetical protein